MYLLSDKNNTNFISCSKENGRKAIRIEMPDLRAFFAFFGKWISNYDMTPNLKILQAVVRKSSSK